MSASSDHPRSSEEENRRTALTSSPLGEIPYDPFRPLWTSGQFAHFTGRTSHGSSPGGVDLPATRSSFEGLNIDSRTPGNFDDYPPHLPSFQSPPTTALSPHLTSSWTHGSAPDQSLVFGTRPDSQELQGYPAESLSQSYPGHDHDTSSYASDTGSTTFRFSGGRRPPYRDEFDGPSQLLPLPLPQEEQNRARTLPQLPVSLLPNEQDEIARRANDILSQCAFHFVAKYQFPIPLERDKRRVRTASDREWTEWAYLLKRLATKRRIPARVLFDGQIKQLVTTLENSIAVRQTINTRAEPPTPRQPRDDRYMLQLLSSGLQVAKILVDSMAMEQLNQLYTQTEALILERRSRISSSNRGGVGVGHVPRSGRDSLGRTGGRGGRGGSVGSGAGGAGGAGGSIGAIGY